jgi:hypothetical protein
MVSPAIKSWKTDEPEEEDEEAEFETLAARVNDRPGRPAFTPAAVPPRSLPTLAPVRQTLSTATAPGMKRRTPKQIREDMPPTPRGCEWRRADEGWNLWRYWAEPDESGDKIKKTRYTGHLSHDAWQIMKEYNHEAFLSIVGQRLRRHGRG